ncbi:MAG: hypothetical protein ACYDDQ_00335 [Vulcanimicrobiaceae bacterium]
MTIHADVRDLRAAMDLRFDSLRDGLNAKIDAKTDGLTTKIDAKTDGLNAKIDGTLRTMISWMIAQTAVIVGALAAVAYALHK